MALSNKFECKMLSIFHEREVLELIRNHYSEDYGAIFGLSRNDVEEVDAFRVKMVLKQYHCAGVFEKATNKLVAATINSRVDKNASDCFISNKSFGPSLDTMEKHGLNLSLRYRTYHRLFDVLKEDVFERLQVDSFLFGGMATVHKDYRKSGVISALFSISSDMLSDTDCKFILVIETSDFLWKANKARGYKTLKEIRLCDYVDRETGTKPFSWMKSPHGHIRLCYKVLVSMPSTDSFGETASSKY